MGRNAVQDNEEKRREAVETADERGREDERGDR